MSSLKLYGSTSGYVEIVPEATAGNNSVTLPNGSGTLVVGDSGGNLNVSGIVTASQINVGTGVTIDSNGINIGVSTFYGDGSGLTGVTASISIGAGSTSAPSLSPTGDSNTGIFFPSADTIAFAEGGAEVARFDSSGRFGLGTASPGGLLEIASASANPSLLRLYNAINSSTSWGIDFYRDAGAGNNVLRAEVKAVREGNDATGIKFSTTNTGAALAERARFGYDGSLGISDSGTGNAYATTYGTLTITRAQNQGDNRFHLAFHREASEIVGMGYLSNSTTFAIQHGDNNSVNGVTLTNAATSWGTTSDERKKQILGYIDNGLDSIQNWRTVYFSYIGEDDSVRRVGLIAQDVQSTLPEAVTAEDDEDGTLQLKYTEVIPMLVKALQETQTRIETLEAEVAALKNP